MALRTVAANESSAHDMSDRQKPGTNSGTRTGGFERLWSTDSDCFSTQEREKALCIKELVRYI
jgi:hypothetical protein